MILALCSFCSPQVHPQESTLPWLQDHLEHFHNITQQTEAALCFQFLNLNEKIELQQLVAPRMKFLEWGEHDTDGDIFGPAVNMVPWLDETLLREDTDVKDKEMADEELKDIQDHLLAECSDDNYVNKKVSDDTITYDLECWDPDRKWKVQDVYNHMGESLEKMFLVLT